MPKKIANIVTPTRRRALEKRARAVGVLAIARVLGESYNGVNQRINGYQPMSETWYDSIEAAIASLETK